MLRLHFIRPKWAEALDDKEMLFVNFYLDSLNAAEAARAVGLRQEQFRRAGPRAAARPHVAEAINKTMAERLNITRSRVLEEISKLAFSNIADVLSVENGQLVVKEHADLDRDTLSTIASIEEHISERGGHRTLRVKQHDRLQALTILAKLMGMFVSRTEVSGPNGRPMEVEHSVSPRERITRRLDEMAERVAAPTEQPIIDVTPARQASPSAVLTARIEPGKRDE